MASIVVFSTNYVVAARADVYITASAKHAYSNSDGKSWALEIWFGGNLAKSTGGQGARTDCPNILLGIESVAAGTYTVELKWTADTPLQLQSPTMVIQSSYK